MSLYDCNTSVSKPDPIKETEEPSRKKYISLLLFLITLFDQIDEMYNNYDKYTSLTDFLKQFDIDVTNGLYRIMSYDKFAKLDDASVAKYNILFIIKQDDIEPPIMIIRFADSDTKKWFVCPGLNTSEYKDFSKFIMFLEKHTPDYTLIYSPCILLQDVFPFFLIIIQNMLAQSNLSFYITYKSICKLIKNILLKYDFKFDKLPEYRYKQYLSDIIYPCNSSHSKSELYDVISKFLDWWDRYTKNITVSMETIINTMNVILFNTLHFIIDIIAVLKKIQDIYIINSPINELFNIIISVILFFNVPIKNMPTDVEGKTIQEIAKIFDEYLQNRDFIEKWHLTSKSKCENSNIDNAYIRVLCSETSKDLLANFTNFKNKFGNLLEQLAILLRIIYE